MRILLLFPAVLFLSAGAEARDTRPATAQPAADVQQQVLDRVNRARSRGLRCGSEYFEPAAPLTLSKALFEAAREHAQDMARRAYFDHRAADGSQPKDRVRRAGYRPRLTGENIAFAPETAEEVVAGWLDSPGHCANIMDARFSQMGVAVAKGRERGHFYWVQTLAAPIH